MCGSGNLVACRGARLLTRYSGRRYYRGMTLNPLLPLMHTDSIAVSPVLSMTILVLMVIVMATERERMDAQFLR